MRIKFRDVALDAMIEERDHLKIRINLIEDPDIEALGSATATRAALAELEERIRHYRSAPGFLESEPAGPETESEQRASNALRLSQET